MASLVEQISAAFAHRPKPTGVVEAGQPATEIYDDARYFAEKYWQDVTCQELGQYRDAVFGFSPEAFCYFLPGIYCAGIRENQPTLIVNGSLIGMLDRANQPPAWDEFFLERWCRLSREECEAKQLWISWLSEVAPQPFSDDSLSRAFDTVTLISNSSVFSRSGEGSRTKT